MDTSQTMLLNQIQNTNSELLKKIKETENINNLLLLNYYKTTNQIILHELKEITRKNIELEQKTLELIQKIKR